MGAAALGACSSGEPEDAVETRMLITGQVVDAGGAPIAGVQIEGDGMNAVTDASGNFEVEVAQEGSAVLIFRAEGFVRGLERVDIASAGRVPLQVTMVAIAPAIPFDVDAGGEVIGMRGATMNAAPNVFRDRAGNVATGMVDVHLTPLNPSVQAELDAYPGDGLARDASGDTIHLETFGVLDVTVMQGNEELNIVDGMGVEIKVPLPDPLPSDPPESIALWGFDDAAGVWVEEGIATLDLEAGVYTGTIGHLSPWNCDQPLSATCLKGRALDRDGDPARASYIVARGNDYSGASTAVADEDGHFCVPVRKDSSVTITVHGPNGGRLDQEVSSGSADTDIPPVCSDPRCQDLGDFVMADEGDSDGWEGSCEWGEDADLRMNVSGYRDGELNWEGEPWFSVCGGFTGGASDGSLAMFFPEAMSSAGLSVILLAELGLGETANGVPLDAMFSDDGLTSGAGWITDVGTCTADITENDLIAPGLYRVEGTGRCTGPARDVFGMNEDIAIEGEFSFAGVVVAGEAASDTIVECCYGDTGYPLPE